MYCPEFNSAKFRLETKGIPGTAEVQDSGKDQIFNISQATQSFITLIDTLELKMRATDELLPAVKDLVMLLNKISLDASLNILSRVAKWNDTLNSMGASDELNDDQVRQISMDINSAYEDFTKSLRG